MIRECLFHIHACRGHTTPDERSLDPAHKWHERHMQTPESSSSCQQISYTVINAFSFSFLLLSHALLIQGWIELKFCSGNDNVVVGIVDGVGGQVP